MGWIGQVFCLSNPKITWSLITYYDENVGTRLTDNYKYLLRYKNSLSVCRQFSTDRLQILCQPSRLDRAIMASWTETWTDKVSTHICIFYKFFEFSRICLSLPFMPNLLSNIKILLLLPNILIRSEVWRGNWYHHKDKFKSNWAFYFLSILVSGLILNDLIKIFNIYGYSVSEDVVWLESSLSSHAKTR